MEFNNFIKYLRFNLNMKIHHEYCIVQQTISSRKHIFEYNGRQTQWIYDKNADEEKTSIIIMECRVKVTAHARVCVSMVWRLYENHQKRHVYCRLHCRALRSVFRNWMEFRWLLAASRYVKYVTWMRNVIKIIKIISRDESQLHEIGMIIKHHVIMVSQLRIVT